jgi:branched-chain amino acid transport system substrate-binding protein
MEEYKIGVLLPRSSLYPMLSMDLISGLKNGFRSFGVTNVKFCYENIDFGGVEATVYSKVEKLLLEENVSMIIAFMDHTEAFKLEPLFRNINRLLIVLDPGGHIPLNWQTSPFCYTLSLQAALGSRLTGQLATTEGSMRPVFATSFYEGGYLQCFSYLKGLQNGGGAVQAHLVVPFQREDFKIDPLHQAFEMYKPDSILAQFSAESGAFFLNEYISSGLYKELKLYSSPFMLEETWLSTIPYPFDGIRGYVTWFKDLSCDSNTFFLNQIEEETGTAGNIFSMFGWEAAQFIIQCKQILNTYGNKILPAQSELENIAFESPRGTVKMHAATHHLIAPMYITEIISTINKRCKLKLIEEDTAVAEKFEHYIADKPEGIFSKWTNTYLCI